MTKQKKLKSILLLTLSILMLAIMAVYPVINKTVSAESGSNNLFDMQLFNEENIVLNRPSQTEVIGLNEYAISYKFDTSGELGNNLTLKSGLFYLESGIYTLSAYFETTIEDDFQLFLTNDEDESIHIGTIVFNCNNEYKKNTFTVGMSGFYYLRILHVYETTQEETNTLRNIMLNKGSDALPFERYIEINDEIDAINQGSDNIIAKLDELFGTNSGLIAGASLGTVVLLLVFLYLFIRRR